MRPALVGAILTFLLVPAALPAQRVASERAGFAPPVALASADTVRSDSVAPHRSRVVDAIGGGIIGTIVGGVAGLIYAQEAEKHCGDGPCLVGLAIPFGAA